MINKNYKVYGHRRETRRGVRRYYQEWIGNITGIGWRDAFDRARIKYPEHVIATVKLQTKKVSYL